MPRFLVIKGTDEGKQFELTEPQFGIGRDTQNKIRLHDTEVSRRHAECVRAEADAGYVIRDVGSANGTFVNNKKVNQTLLQAGDRVQVGQTVLVYSAGADARQAQSELAEHINLISRHDMELSSAIIRTVAESEGSQILTHPEKAKTPWLRTQLANLTIMYEASQAVSHILDLDELLKRILELIFRSISADRGCIMLQNPENDAFEPKALHFRNKADQQEKINVSRTIVDHVLREREGVIVSDAAQDERFNTGASIVRFGIREVICVPMKGRHETLGVLYLDTRSNVRDVAGRKTSLGKFTEDHLNLAIAIAHQAALAVEETRYHRAMVQAERLAAIGMAISALSHHIKNILQGLKSGTDILKMGIADGNDGLLQQGSRIVEKNQRRIEEVVLDMLSYSNPDREPDVTMGDLNEVAREVHELMAPRAQELKVKFELSLGKNLPPLPIDRVGVHRALSNIVGNALDAVEERENPEVAIGTRRDPDPNWLRIVVLDNGTGIPPEKLQDIFKVFVTTKGSRGTGLGLAVSRKIIREHGGDIHAESVVGKGSKFTIRLPVRGPLNLESSVHDATLIPPHDDGGATRPAPPEPPS